MTAAGPSRPPRTWPRRVALAVAAFVLLLAVALVLVTQRRHALAERAIGDWLLGRGVEPSSLRVTDLDPGGIGIEDVSVGPTDAPDLTAGRVDATWSRSGLQVRRLDTVHVSGLRLRAKVGDQGLQAGSLDPLLAGPEREPDAEAPPAAMPFDSLTLDDARVELDTEYGPLVIAGHLEGPAEALRLEASISEASGPLRAEAKGELDLEARNGALDFTLAPLVFAPAGLQPQALPPLLAEPLVRAGVTEVAGKVEARGRAILEGDAVAYELRVATRELAFATPLALVQGLTAALELRGPPLHMPKTQPVAIALLDLGIPLADGLVELRLHKDGALAVRRARWRVAGGEIRTADVTLDAKAKRTPATLTAHELDLAELLAMVELEGLAGTGRIQGTLPLVVTDDAVLAEGGKLEAVGGGTIQYRPNERARAVAESRPYDLALAFAAFEDFRYEVLEARLDGDLRGETKIALHVRGVNPTFQDGRPVELNLNLEARLADLVRSGLASYRVPEAVEERLRAFSEEKR